MSEEEQSAINLGLEPDAGKVPAEPAIGLQNGEVIGLAILGQGSETPELHVRYTGYLKTFPLTNPVTATQIADILSPLA